MTYIIDGPEAFKESMSPMRITGLPPRAVGRCVVLAVATLALAMQIATTAWRSLASSRPAELDVARVVVGDTVRFVASMARHDVATVFYAFDSECPQSRAVASKWAEHFKALPAESRVRRLAVSRENPVAAAAYAKQADWGTDVLSLAHVEPDDHDFFLVARTPWVFVVDSIGVVRYHGHGNDLSQAERALRLLRHEASGRANRSTKPQIMGAVS